MAQAQVWVQLCECGHVLEHPCATLSPFVKPFWQTCLSELSGSLGKEPGLGPLHRQHSPASGGSAENARGPGHHCSRQALALRVLTPGATGVREPVAPLAAGRSLGQPSMAGVAPEAGAWSVWETWRGPQFQEGVQRLDARKDYRHHRALGVFPPIWNTVP